MYCSAAFDTTTPTGLQNKVWFEIMLYFCRRGRENLRELTKESFKINQAANGRKYVLQVKDELTKNRREEQESEECGLMFETGLVSCPVKSFEKIKPKLCCIVSKTKKAAAGFRGSRCVV